MAYKAAFSFYGGKSRIAHLYPSPQFDLVIEPFAGGGSYSLRHRWGKWALLNDLDPKTFKMWQFIQDGVQEYLDIIPDGVEVGLKVSEWFAGCPDELIHILQSEANQGTQGAKGVHDQVTSMGQKCWHRIKDKLLWAHLGSANWHITNLDYRHLPNIEATWFVDPPYNNEAGKRYRHSLINYEELAEWCRTRKGQVIVCENEGAEWLPFEPLVERRGVRSRYQTSTAKEVMWTNAV